MRRASTLAVTALVAAGGLLLAGTAAAQSAGAQRYLSWQGRREPTPPAEAAPATPLPTGQRRPNTVIPHGGFAAAGPVPSGLTPAPGPRRAGLTPANAWLRPAASRPEPAPASPPPPPSAPPPQRPVGPEYLPDQGGRAQPAPAEAVYPAAAYTPEAAPPPEAAPLPADPMAPRRDAPIFHMRRDPPQPPASRPEAETGPARTAAETSPPPVPRVMEVAGSGERPEREGARYYSVHRQTGRDPDPLDMPAPTYVDALVVSMAETPATQDLAAPAEGPTLIRDRNGNLRAAPAASDGDHQ